MILINMWNYWQALLYVTIWAEGNYYILGKREYSEELEHFRIDHLKDITILERGIDMIFGGLNPGQYAEKRFFKKGNQKHPTK